MSAGPERLSRVDHDGGQLRRRLLPGRADPERPDDGGNVKPLPLVLPAGSDRAARDRAEARPQPARPRLVREGDELDRLPGLLLRKALGKQLEHARRRLFDPIARHHDRGAYEAQRKALFSFSKKPSSER